MATDSPRPAHQAGPVRRWLRAGLPVILIAALAVAVVLTVRGAAPWSEAQPGAVGNDPGNLGIVPPADPTVSGSATPTVTASVTVTPTPTPTTVAAPYLVQPGQTFALKPAIAAARELLASPTDFRVSTFNVLGNSHTTAGGDRPSWASGVVRMGWAWQLLGGASVDVIGFQEFQMVQIEAFRSLTGGAFEVYPGTAQGWQNAENSIGWRTDAWQAVETHTIGIPYFGGNERQMPYVLLRNVASGQLVWFVNVHNPADKFGGAQQWRDIATARQSALVNQLGADGTPVILTGDLNDRETAYCALTATTSLHAADGGSSVGGCLPPAQPAVDWIFGNEPVQFISYTRVTTGLVNQTTDHPFVWAEVHIEPTAAASP